MTTEEIILIKELIDMSVKAAVKEAVRESLKKDLKEVKLLMVKLIKEGRNGSGNVVAEKSNFLQLAEAKVSGKNKLSTEQIRTVRESYSADTPYKSSKPIISTIQASRMMETNDIPPDMDAPIPQFNTNSDVFQSLQEKIG